MSGVLVLGGGGHGKVVADILLCEGVAVRGFLDDDPHSWNSTCLGLPVLGAIDTFGDYMPAGMIMGVGSNAARRKIVERLGAAATSLWINAIHPRSIVAASARLGSGVVIAAGAIVNPDTVIGDHVIINTAASVDHDGWIGDYAHLAPGVHLSGGVEIGAGTLIGVGSSVLPYCTVGEWTIVGGGATVVRDVPGHVIAKGVPARW